MDLIFWRVLLPASHGMFHPSRWRSGPLLTQIQQDGPRAVLYLDYADYSYPPPELPDGDPHSAICPLLSLCLGAE